ncbi:MAG: hypothetical protein IIT68_00935 [Treponema sp.]|nr:hypothetical protein [Treponema sp.]
MDQNRPRGREKYTTGNSTGVHKRGDGLGTGPVGSSNGYAGKNGSFSQHKESGSGGGSFRAVKAGGGISLPVLIVIVVLYLLFFRGGNSGTETAAPSSSTSQSTSGSLLSGLLESVTGGGSSMLSSAASSSGGGVSTSYSRVDTSVAKGSRAKRTNIIGNGKDSVTIMVYMCGTDLESQYGMATNDLKEMASADLGNINIIVYTGGCSKWQNSAISNSTNQIYRVTKGGLECLVKSDGSKPMTDPNTLSSFIKWAAKNYPANRNELIFWDHGGGSVSGYGYDEKFQRNGSMNLAGINKALKAGGVQFDFIGFDACLMATAETALMLNDYADYMIASEETEPGIGWYYTNWLTKFAANTSMSTLDIGKNIVDDFVSMCAQQCRGQQTTLSVIDLAEFSNTVPNALSSFSKSLSNLIANKEYQTVSDARYTTREFASSTRIDQVDLVDLCKNVDTAEANALAKALQSAVKYNRTSSNMTDAYGVSIYFPYQRASYVDEICDTYDDIGMDDDYATAIRQFASLEVSGQVAAGGSSSPVGSLLGLLGSGAGTSSSSDVISGLLGSFLSNAGSGLISGLSGRNVSFMNDRALSADDTANYIALNHFDVRNLTWTEYSDGSATMKLPEDQWALVHSLDLNMFYDDGTGYIDLGLDNIYDWTREGDLIAETDRSWLSINGQPVAYYHVDTTENGNTYSITGRVPALLNGTRVNLWLVFDSENPRGYIAGAQTDYENGETLTVAKNLIQLKDGDKLDFLCDYYSYKGEYLDSYKLGEQMTIRGTPVISNEDVGTGAVKLTYRFTDIYNQVYWSEALER